LGVQVGLGVGEADALDDGSTTGEADPEGLGVVRGACPLLT